MVVLHSWMQGLVVDTAHERQVRPLSRSMNRMVEVKLTSLSSTARGSVQADRPQTSNNAAVGKQAKVLWFAFADLLSISCASPLGRRSDVADWARGVPHALVLGMLRMNRLCVLGLLNVSLSSSLYAYQRL